MRRQPGHDRPPAGSPWWLVVLVCAAGCDGSSANVTGTVTLDGQPISCGPQMYGTVSYYRADGGGAPAVGLIDSSGQYTLRTGAREGLEPGSYVVGVAVKKITMPTTPDGMPRPHLITPRKYASTQDSGFTAEVEPGNNTLDFALVSTPGE